MLKRLLAMPMMKQESTATQMKEKWDEILFYSIDRVFHHFRILNICDALCCAALWCQYERLNQRSLSFEFIILLFFIRFCPPFADYELWRISYGWMNGQRSNQKSFCINSFDVQFLDTDLWRNGTGDKLKTEEPLPIVKDHFDLRRIWNGFLVSARTPA